MKKGSAKAVPAGKRTAAEKLQYVKKNWQLYVFFLLPALLLTIIFKYVPMGGVLIAFEDYNVIDGVFGSKWVGLEYFRRFLASPDFMNYLVNTLKLSIYGLLWGFPIPIILALLLNQIRRAGIRKKIQLLIYAPNFISVIVLCGMVRMFLSPVGPLNKLIGSDANWMTMPAAFRTIYIASGIWQTAGWASIMYTAALANASKDLEEAAVVDGANILQQIWYVQLPAIKNIIVIQFILQAGNIMSIGFEKAYALQTDMKEASRYLDYVQLMTYDLQGGFQKVTGHHAALYHSEGNLFDACVQKAVNGFVNAGVPMEKLILGVPFYSRKWDGVKGAGCRNGLGMEAETVGGYGGDYGELKESWIGKRGFIRYWDEQAKVPYLFDGETFISYEDCESLGVKIAYLKEKGMGGIMFWEYKCDPSGELLSFIKKNM